MGINPPVVYILHGEDVIAIAQFVAALQAKLGDSSLVDLNTNRLEGEALAMDELRNIASAMPFLAERRLVIVTNPCAKFTHPSARKGFIEFLEKVPDTTALVLIEPRSLTDEKDRKQNKINWLEKWARSSGERVSLKAFPLPKGDGLNGWIQDQARAAGGQFSRTAAGELASLVGGDPQQLVQEINKLLVYVNYSRTVQPEDVQNLTVYSKVGDVFAMVDAMGNRNVNLALKLYRQLLIDQEAAAIFWMVIRQFRLLLLAREVLDGGGTEREVERALKIHPFVAKKISAQARRFTLFSLEAIYRRLLELDEAMKTGQTEADLALDTLITGLTLSEKSFH